jgi:Ca2+-binding RTX toxin-like protein
VTDVNATDTDTKQTLTYSIIGDDATLFTINSSTGVLAFKSAPNFESPTDKDADGDYLVTVQVSDGNGGTDSQDLTIHVTDVNEASPVISSNGGTPTATINVAENGTAVTDVNATDADTKQTLTYSISGDDAGLFTISSSTGLLTFTNAPDFESPTDKNGDGNYLVTVQVSDGNGGTDSQDLTIHVTDVNEGSPVITSNGGGPSDTFDFAENSVASVTDVNATDVDTKQTLTYSITGDDANLFTIDANTGVLAFKDAPDFENPTDKNTDGDYLVTVHASDGNGGTDLQALTIHVTDVDPEVLTGTSGDNTLTAKLGNYHLDGLAGSDTLVGNTGNDLLIGGLGDDKMTGGGGTNTFEFSLASSAGADTITDFNKSQDVLSFKDVFDSDTSGTIDLNDLHAAISSVDDGPSGGDVTVHFNSGASIVFEGAGSGAGTITSIDDLVSNTSTQIQTA